MSEARDTHFRSRVLRSFFVLACVGIPTAAFLWQRY